MMDLLMALVMENGFMDVYSQSCMLSTVSAIYLSGGGIYMSNYVYVI